jgi:hypothetical protein
MYKYANRFRQHRSDIGRPLGHGLGQYGNPQQRQSAIKRKHQAEAAKAAAASVPRVTKPKRPKPPPPGLRLSYSDLLLLRKCLNEAMSREDLTGRQRERLTAMTVRINRELAEQRR